MNKSKIKIGIECEQIEGQAWGIGRVVLKLLEDIAGRPELAEHYEFYLYFKSFIPDYPCLDNPIFHKEIIRQPFPHKSFVLYYYVFLPIRLWFAGLDAMYFPNYMLPIIFFGKSLVLMTDDIYYEMRSSEQRFHHRLAYWVFGTWTTWFATRIMAISESSKWEMVRLFHIIPRRIAVNHLAVDEPRHTGENKNGKYILYVGQAFPRRHLAETMLAFETIARQFSDLCLIAIGPDKYRPARIATLQREINQRLGREAIVHHDYISDNELAELYAHAESLAYISSREAFGLPPLEALSYKTVAVVAGTPVNREIFGENTFFVHEPYSADLIAHALRESINDAAKRNEIIADQPALMRQYTWRAHTDRFLNIIQSISR